MFTEKAMKLIESARNRAHSLDRPAVDLESFLAAMSNELEAVVRMADCLTGGDTAAFRARCPVLGAPVPYPEKMPPDTNLRLVLDTALALASGEGVPDRTHPGFIGLEHLVCATAMSRSAIDILGDGLTPLKQDEAIKFLSAWLMEAEGVHALGALVERLRALRTELLSKVFGQDHAVQAFVEGLYNSGVTATADKERKRPEGIFVFVGPPGVGKTYMAELCSVRLERPFRRFDMTAYSDHQAHNDLVGFAPSYQGAQPGKLTGFVSSHPNAILLFDEIEKAHLNTMQLFYQILDAGRLEDKYLGQEVSFRDALIIFTTNAGKSLYDDPNRMGIGVANAVYHKRTILSALEKERNPSDGRPAFPPAICSRLGQGYPVMFNHLGVNELERIAHVEMRRAQSLLERQYFKVFRHDERLPIALVYREGAHVDARQLRSEAEKFIKAELFRFCSLYARDRVEEALEDIDEVVYSVSGADSGDNSVIEALYQPVDPPRILLAADVAFLTACQGCLHRFDWRHAGSPAEALDKLAVEDVDFVLLDLWLGGSREDHTNEADYMALEARELDQGREMLKRLHERFPLIPIYLLSFTQPLADTACTGVNTWGLASTEPAIATMTLDASYAENNAMPFGNETWRRPIDDELLLACVRAGGARGLVATDFGVGADGLNKERAAHLAKSLLAIHRRIYREKKARALSRERKVLAFDTVADLDKEKRILNIGLRNFRLTRALDASDAGEMIEDVARPSTRFADVLGEVEAKKSMQFIVDWLRNAKKYAALGLRPPKGVLMTGPPGTGKTMLARAVAGESDCAFMEKSATSFVTMWQGSGPQNVRELFARARRYAPTILFIDEIDAIGRERSGATSGRAQEETLNALLTEMDGFGGTGDHPIIVLAATNMADLLDGALKRRFDRLIEVDKPDREARLTYLKGAMAARSAARVSDETLNRLAGQSAGMTIANLERVVQEAGVMAVQEGALITDELLEEAFEKTRMGAATQAPEPKTLERIARHEAGHTLVAWRGGNKPVQVTIVGRGGAGGFMERDADEMRILYTKPQLEQIIREAMGGRAAELLYYGEEDGLSTGVSSDLKHASRVATGMVQEYGMDSEVGQLAIDDNSAGVFIGDGPLRALIAQQARRIVDTQLNEAFLLLKQNRAALDTLVAELMRKNRLTKEELEKILD